MDIFIQKKNVLNQIDGYGRTLDQEHYMAFYSDFKGKSINQIQRLLQENYIPNETKKVINFYFGFSCRQWTLIPEN